MMTDDTYWGGAEAAQLCGGFYMQIVLQEAHDSPDIDPIPGMPCGETMMCDSTRFNAFLYIIDNGGELMCTADVLSNINSYNPYRCDAANFEFFISNNGHRTKAILCYCSPDAGPCPP